MYFSQIQFFHCALIFAIFMKFQNSQCPPASPLCRVTQPILSLCNQIRFRIYYVAVEYFQSCLMKSKSNCSTLINTLLKNSSNGTQVNICILRYLMTFQTSKILARVIIYRCCQKPQNILQAIDDEMRKSRQTLFLKVV